LFLNQLKTTILEKAKTAHANYKILIGDIHLDVLRTSLHTNKYLNFLVEFGYFKIIDTITRHASNSCLVHIFMKSKIIHYSKSIVSPITISDHYPIFLIIGNLVTEIINQIHSQEIKYTILYYQI
jgi:hypothetical protein